MDQIEAMKAFLAVVDAPGFAGAARQVGVSTATVSYVLNDRPGVSAQTRERILDLAESMGLTPSKPPVISAARSASRP